MPIVRAAIAAALIILALAACSSAGPAAGPGPGEVPAASRDVSFDVAGTATRGTLEVPAHRSGQHLAAALLLAGSGPTDRNGDQPAANVNPDTLKLVAGVLAQQGIMTLRFDKYFTGQTGAGAFAADPAAVDLDAYIRQADAAYAFLAGQPAADRQHLLVVGHSEGGFYAMLVADTVSPRPAGLALLEPQDERILSLLALQLDEQLNAAVQQGQLGAAAARQQGEGIDSAITEFRAGQQADTAGLLPQIVQELAPELLTPVNAAVARTDDAVSPAAAAAKVRAGTRVLITDGTGDTNIPVSTIGPLASALADAGTAGPGLKVLTGVNHLLHLPGTPDNDAVLAPAVTAALRSWAQPYALAG